MNENNVNVMDQCHFSIDQYMQRMAHNNVQEQIAMAEFLMNYRQNKSLLNCRQTEQQRKISSISLNELTKQIIIGKEKEALIDFINQRKQD